ncbi:MAG: NAD kinase [Alphaproteobacteria bacterium]|nr:NAD kinase [Alphaproteobacteria bacterium]
MKIHFTASHSLLAQQSFAAYTKRYGQVPLREADIVVALGGDGHVLRMLYDAMEIGKPVFAIRRTDSVGFLCNDYTEEDLQERLAKAQSVTLHPLRIEAVLRDGSTHMASAINEITVLRETPQAVRLRILIDGIERIASFSGDGILVSTPAGSTAYNHSCGGPIMPLDSNTLVMTAISGYRPRRWTSAVLPQKAVVTVEVMEIEKRPVRIESGASVIRDVASAKIWLDCKKDIALMFDPGAHLGERIIREQFML